MVGGKCYCHFYYLRYTKKVTCSSSCRKSMSQLQMAFRLILLGIKRGSFVLASPSFEQRDWQYQHWGAVADYLFASICRCPAQFRRELHSFGEKQATNELQNKWQMAQDKCQLPQDNSFFHLFSWAGLMRWFVCACVCLCTYTLTCKVF